MAIVTTTEKQIAFSFNIPFESLGALRKTAQGAELWCIACNFDLKMCREEVQMLNKKEALESERIWYACLEHCDNDKSEAERIMLDLGRVPPFYAGVIECAQCGFMPYERSLPGVLKRCKWCNSLHRQETNRIKKQACAKA